MIVLYRRDFSAYGIVTNVWLAGVEMKLRERAAQLGVRFEIRVLKEDDDAEPVRA